MDAFITNLTNMADIFMNLGIAIAAAGVLGALMVVQAKRKKPE